jgi:hypothetical protein
MSNANCTCPGPGHCERHGIDKTQRKFELCKGINCTAAQCTKYWNAWEAGRGTGQLAPPPDPKPVALPQRSRGLGDTVGKAIKRVTGWQPCGGCNQRAALLNHWFPATLPPIEPVNLEQPVRHLTFHLWPVAGFGAWQWNCDQLLAHAHLFNGRRIVAIATSAEADAAETVQHYLRDFTDEFVVMPNSPKLREVATWLPMIERLENYQGPADVTFACHSKCVRHKIGPESAGSTLFRWTAAMFETCLDWDAVRPLLEQHGTVGSFRRYMPNAWSRGAWGPWHYSGTFFWWRNRDAFARNWRYVPQKFFGTEAWPGWLFKAEESACLVGDNCGDLYKLDYWEREIEPQLAAWRAARAHRS